MSNETRYQENFARIKKVINLEPVNRIPIIYMGAAFAPRYMGLSMADNCSDADANLEAGLATMDRLGELDGCNLSAGRLPGPTLTGLWLSHVALPGRELPPDSLWQVQEAEVMTHADYDTILKKGWKSFLSSYWPRVIDPADQEKAAAYAAANGARNTQRYVDKGYVIVCDVPPANGIPFEYLCGARSMTQFFFDLYRMPDKVQAVLDVILEEELEDIRTRNYRFGIGGTWVGGWRAASALLAPKLWNRFVWPYYLKIVDALIARGVTPVLHWDQDWTRDLERLKELPSKKCLMNPDGMTDMTKFKEVAGDRMAMMGDVPASLLVTGTPEDVFKYVRDLVDLFEGKGLILCPGCDAPINAKPENMQAFVAAGREYGRVA
ncbi:MAG: hypothetical protein M1570_13485 [Chloroflexi bacterium]|nr:hypothetical protein [Chloroflexota bacterium]